jgi:hypothetical protein
MFLHIHYSISVLDAINIILVISQIFLIVKDQDIDL